MLLNTYAFILEELFFCLMDVLLVMHAFHAYVYVGKRENMDVSIVLVMHESQFIKAK